jgi:hypothetical protein
LEGGEQVLDAGDVVAAAASSGMAWQLGKVATKAWQAARRCARGWRCCWRAARGQVVAGQFARVKRPAAGAHGGNREAGGGR